MLTLVSLIIAESDGLNPLGAAFRMNTAGTGLDELAEAGERVADALLGGLDHHPDTGGFPGRGGTCDHHGEYAHKQSGGDTQVLKEELHNRENLIDSESLSSFATTAKQSEHTQATQQHGARLGDHG